MIRSFSKMKKSDISIIYVGKFILLWIVSQFQKR